MKKPNTQYTRRDFGHLAGLGISFLGAASLAAAKSKIPIALELYSIRKDCAADLAGSVAKVAEMGYDAVEFAGYHGHSAAAVSKMLKDNGLTCCSVHAGWATVQPDMLAETIDFNKEIGNDLLVVPGLPGPIREAKSKYPDVAKQFNEIAAKAKEQGMSLGYHNHTWEFEGEEGKRFWDVLGDNTPKDFVMQLDVGHCRRSGRDPVAYIKKYAGRSRVIHVKDFSPKSEEILLGEGIVDWKAVFGTVESVGGIETYIIEQERYPHPPMECAKRCLDNLKKLLA